MTTTPEQLQAWREEFHKAFPARALTEYDQAPTDNDYIFVGYLRAKQETEQAIKDARKQALEDVIQCVNSERGGSTDNLILALRELLK